MQRENSILELAGVFLRLGLTAFGGPAAHISMMQQEFVERRAWLSREELLDRIGAANLIPGPSSTEVAIHVGYQRAGWLGLVLAGTCFILPAFLMVMAIAWSYTRIGKLPQAAGLLYGVKPVVIAIVVQALWNLGRTAVKSRLLAALGSLALALAFLGANPLALLLGAGALMAASRWLTEKPRPDVRPLRPLILLVGGLVAVAVAFSAIPAASRFGLGALFLVFLKLGSVVYGSGYVLLAFLRADLVTHRAWLSSGQLLDAVAVGQVTPGPVFTTATFIGFLLAGPSGALVATAGIFLPAFFLVGVTGPFVARLRESPIAGAFLDGVNMAALALMAFVTWQLGRAALVDAFTIVLAVASAVVLLRFRLNSAWLILAGALAGWGATLANHTVW